MKRAAPRARRRISGMSMVEVMVAIAVLGIVVVGASAMWENLWGEYKRFALRSDALDAGLEVRSRGDCWKTVTAMGAACSGKTKTSPADVAIRDANNSVLVPAISGTLPIATGLSGKGQCYDDGLYWAFLVNVTSTTSGYSAPAFQDMDFRCPKIQSCSVQLPNTVGPPTPAFWIERYGPGRPGGFWCSGAGRLVIPDDAADIAVTLDQVWADERCARVTVNGTTVFQDAGPCGGVGFSFYPATNISAPFLPGENVIKGRGYDGVGGYCGIGMRATLTFKASSCVLNWAPDCGAPTGAFTTACDP